MGAGQIERLARLVVAAVVVALPVADVAAQESADCCFANPRFAGGCAVTPSGGETCTSILAYLNGLSGVGKTYCNGTDVRGGWAQVPCTAGGTTMGAKEPVEAKPAEMYSMPSWTPSVSPDASPELKPLVVKPGSVIQVKMDDAVDLGKLPAGTSFAAHLGADLVVDGAVAAPAGSPVYGRLVKAQGQAQPVLELTDLTLDGRLVPVVADATSGAAVGLPVAAGAGHLDSGETVRVDPAVELLLTGDVAGAVGLTRATIQARRQQIVADNLGLTAAEGQAFWPLYREYRAEVEKLGDREADVILDYARVYDNLTDAQARDLIGKAIAVEKDHAKLKQRYLKRFARVLPGVKLARFFQIENRLDTAIDMELAAGIPLAR